MNLDLRPNNETAWFNPIETKINIVMNEIENEFKFKENTLESLFNFKHQKAKNETFLSSNEYRNALIKEIEAKANSGEITSTNTEILSNAKYEVLANKIIEINKLTQEIQSGIQELRAELLKDSFKEISLWSNSLITKKWYSQNTLTRIDNPETFSDNLLGFSIGTIETIAIIWKFWYDIAKDFVLSPYHLVQIMRGKAKYNGVEI